MPVGTSGCCAAVVLLLAGEVAPADSVAAGVAPGDRIRYAAHAEGDRWTAGRVVDVSDRWLLVRPASGSAVRVPLASLERLEVWWGRPSRAWTGAAIGFAAGAALGLSVASIEGSCCCTGCADLGHYAKFGALGGAATAPLGALIGWMFKTGRWESVPMEPVSLEA